jgi:hypothetical protein
VPVREVLMAVKPDRLAVPAAQPWMAQEQPIPGHSELYSEYGQGSVLPGANRERPATAAIWVGAE